MFLSLRSHIRLKVLSAFCVYGAWKRLCGSYISFWTCFPSFLCTSVFAFVLYGGFVHHVVLEAFVSHRARWSVSAIALTCLAGVFCLFLPEYFIIVCFNQIVHIYHAWVWQFYCVLVKKFVERVLRREM